MAAEVRSRIGLWSAVAVAASGLAYLGALAMGFASLVSADDPIADPWFLILELLILVQMPALVLLFAAIHDQAPREVRSLTLAALAFATALAVLTSLLHFAILTLGRNELIQQQDWFAPVFGFVWPSFAYAVDILAWDLFFPLAMFCAAPAFGGDAAGRSIRALMLVSGGLALAGLAGVPTGDMSLRNIGILGYAVVFPLAAILIARKFARTV